MLITFYFFHQILRVYVRAKQENSAEITQCHVLS